MNRSRALFLAAPGLGRSPGAKFAARESESAAQLPGVGRHTAGGVLRLYRSDAPFAKVVPIRTPAMEEKALLQRLGACRSLPKPDGRPFVGGMAQLRPPPAIIHRHPCPLSARGSTAELAGQVLPCSRVQGRLPVGRGLITAQATPTCCACLCAKPSLLCPVMVPCIASKTIDSSPHTLVEWPAPLWRVLSNTWSATA